MAALDTEERGTRRSIGAVAFDATSVAAAVAMVVLVLARLGRGMHAGDAAAMVVALPAALFLADLLSAVAHWIGDTLPSETPILGPIVRPFRLHHVDPEAFRRHDVLQRNRNNCLAALPFVAFVYLAAPALYRTGGAFLSATLAMAAITLASATQLHAWAHDDDAPRMVQWLQRCGALLSPDRHARHHWQAHDRSYGIVNGWSNGALDGLALFRRAETLATRLRHLAESGAKLRSRPQ